VRVRDVMTTEVVTASPDAPFPELVDLLVAHDISGLPVVDDDGTLMGIVTEADLVSKQAYGGRRRRSLEVLADLVAGGETAWVIKAKGHLAREVMTPAELATASEADDVRTAARRMIEADVKRLPVVDGDERLVGILSRTDLLKALHRTDDEIATAVLGAFADPMRAPERTDLEVGVVDGIVTIAGVADYPADVEVLTSVAWSMPGVVDVANQARPRYPAPEV